MTEIDSVLREVLKLHCPRNGALNIYDEEACVAVGDPAGSAIRRLGNLRTYLSGAWSAPVVLVGEAPGKHGARLSGVPFTSPRQLYGNGQTEPSATIVHDALRALGVQHDVLLWNACMLYPPGNRDPRPEELEASRVLLRLVTTGRRVLAVGRAAQDATGAPYVRHPANAGKTDFVEGLRYYLVGDGNEAFGPATLQYSRPTAAPLHRSVPVDHYCPLCHLLLPATGLCDCSD